MAIPEKEKEKDDKDDNRRAHPQNEGQVIEETASGSERTVKEPNLGSSEIQKLQEQIEIEKARNEDLVKQMKYLQADIMNLQRQSDRMLVDVRNQSRLGLILELISVKEDLERAMKVIELPSNKKESLLEGLKLLDTKIENSLRAEDVSGIHVKIGSKMDPRLHEAISTRETDESEEGTILSVIGQGYVINGKVIKPALVEVATRMRETSPHQRRESEIQMDATSSEPEKS